MANKILVLDAGHGGNGSTPGKRSPQSMGKVVYEWDLNNNVCNYIANYLKNYNVQIVRSDDTTGKTDISLANRVKYTNNTNPSAMISIHHNAAQEGATGVETYWHSQGSAQDKKLATVIQEKLVKHTGMRNRGVKQAQFAVLGCKSTIPAVLVEGGFYTTKSDFDYITSDKGQQAYAEAVAEAVIEYLGLTKKVTQATTTTTSGYSVNDVVKVKSTATVYANSDKKIPDWVKGSQYKVSKVNGDKLLLDEITSWVYAKDVEKVSSTNTVKTFQVKVVDCTYLNARKTPEIKDGNIAEAVKSGTILTIVGESGSFYKTKSGLYVAKKYCQKI